MAILKILIVEDSELVSDILTEALEGDKQVTVVGVARNGVEALEMVPRLNPDLITMDVWMPIMDGFATVERVMADFPTPILVITSSSLKANVQLSLRMLAAGALDVIEKPSFQDESQWERHRADLIAKVQMLAGIKVVTHLRGKKSRPDSTLNPNAMPTRVAKLPLVLPQAYDIRNEDKATKPLITPRPLLAKKPDLQSATPNRVVPTFPPVPRYQVIAIASSTGGPSALLTILQALPPNLPVAVLVVQHISQGFTQGLVEWLQREIRLKVRIAADHDKLTPGQIFVAPDRRNLTVKGVTPQLVLNDDGDNFSRPSADAMLSSVAQAFGERAIGIVLTGMGSDGAQGLKEMALRGAYTIAQDEATSLIFGMPKAAIDNRAARQVLPLGQIAGTLVQLLQLPA